MNAVKHPPRPTTAQILTSLRKSIAPYTGLLGASTVIAGCTGALIRDNLEWPGVLLCLLFAFAAQAACNVTHRYFDLKSNIVEWTDGNGHTWRSTMLPIYKEAYRALVVIAAIIGFAIMELSGWWCVILAILLVICAWVDVAPPLLLVRTPFGLVLTFIIFGPLGVIGTSLVQSQMGTPTPFNEFDLFPPLLLSFIMGIMAVMCHLGFSYVNYQNDIDNSKSTFTVEFGRRTTRNTFLVLAFTAYAIMWLISILLDYRHPIIDMALPTLWLLAMILMWRRYCLHNDDESLKNGTTTVLPRLTLLCTLLMWLGMFIIFYIIGPPEYPELIETTGVY